MSKGINKALIVETAFEEWGKVCFKNMSLSLVTNKLKITKPALYRYFKNKKELLNEMSNFLFNELIKLSETFFNEIKNKEKEKIILLFIKEYFEFFGKNLYYFLFYIFYLVKDRYFEIKNIIEINNKLSVILADFIKQNDFWIKPEESENLLRYIFSTGIFLTVFTIHEDINKNKILKALNKNQINKLIESINKIVFNGFKSNKLPIKIDFNDIERLHFVNNDPIKRNRIFESIANVVAKFGLWDASIKKIADDLNMSKSSLYLYFKNKKDMISDLIIKEMEKNNIKIQNNICNYDDFFKRLYCALVTMISNFINDKRIILVFDWFHYQGFDFKKVHSKNIKLNSVLSILQEGFENKLIKINLFNIEFISAYLNMQIIKEILLLNLMKKKFEINDIRFIFKMFLYGLNEK